MMKLSSVLLLATLFLAGCQVELPPIKTAYVAHTYVKIDSPNKRELTSEQVQALSQWLARQQSGWRSRISDFAPDTFLIIRHLNEKLTWVYLHGNEIWVGSKMKLLTADERAELLNVLGEKDAPQPTAVTRHG